MRVIAMLSSTYMRDQLLSIMQFRKNMMRSQLLNDNHLKGVAELLIIRTGYYICLYGTRSSIFPIDRTAFVNRNTLSLLAQ